MAQSNQREEHTRPPSSTDAQVEASGARTEALEFLERARGHLYSFHQLMGDTDIKLDEVLDQLRTMGENELADHLESDLIGRNVLPGQWTFSWWNSSMISTGRSSATTRTGYATSW